MSSISIFSLGHKSSESLAAISLCFLFFNITGNCIAIGVGSALETLCSQALTASTDKFIVSKYLQRALIISLVISLLISILWCFTESFLVFFQQDLLVARQSGIFMKFLIPGLFAVFTSECLKKYLQTQGIVKPILAITFAGTVVSFLTQWILVWSPINIGLSGAPLSISLSHISIALLYTCYITICKETRDRFELLTLDELQSVKHILEISRLASSGAMMIVSEWIAFEALALAAGSMGKHQLAAQTISLNIDSFLFMVPMGLGAATSTMVGQHLGRKKPKDAQRLAFMSCILALVPATMSLTLLLCTRSEIGYLFSDDDAVVSLTGLLVPFIAFNQMADSIGSTGGAILRGCGLQKTGAFLNTLGYGMISLPLGFYLAFRVNMGLYGLWIGLSTGLLFVSLGQFLLLFTINWSRVSTEAIERCKSNQNSY